MFKVNINGKTVNMGFFKFPGGEIHFKRKDGLISGGLIRIETDLSNSDEIMKLMLTADHFSKESVVLDLLYLPYARQDRVTSDKEPFSLKTIARMINSCNFKEVILYDPHSDVSPALIDNCVVKKRLDDMAVLFRENSIIVSPDAGAMKANHEIAMKYGFKHVIATKIRDIKTGQITATQVHTDIDLSGKHLLILDDICDGGRTFIELAKVLRKYEPASIELYVTVGIFSNGMDELNKHIDKIEYFHKLGDY